MPEAMLIILGAGASHDCLPSNIQDSMVVNGTVLGGIPLRELRPPLTQQLAGTGTLTNWFTSRWDSAVPAISHLRATLTKTPSSSGAQRVQTLESALREYEDGSLLDPARRRHLLALSFYFRDLFSACTDYVHAHGVGGGDTNQLRLLGQVRQWGGSKAQRTVTFVSFNYDLILEQAMTMYSQFNPLELSDYLNDPLSRLLKPHGSACWHWMVPSPPTDSLLSVVRPIDPARSEGQRAIERALVDEIDRNNLVLRGIAYSSVIGDSAENLIPALALPMDGKDAYVWPAEQRQALDELQGRVTRLMTIGWRALEPEFVPLLGSLLHKSVKVLIVAGDKDGDNDAEAVVQRLRETCAPAGINRWRTYGQGFTGLLERSEELKWFLED
ncbi:hypothetical protein [Ferrimicrobium acidiphilum]|uniref:hypothetical protein n=1 Tax=Ferrimicrobium acidiphilum TaxID=121039 RepID=UPI0023F29A11|nr:hypothetical protein [Ferrimicrobium acidiphilum]